MAALPTSVLFACTFNAVRSPMAEGIAKRLLGGRVYIDSVGVRRRDIDPFVIAVLEEIGISVAKHRPKTFEELEDSSFDLVVSLSPEAQHKAVEMTRVMACEVEFWHTFDPSVIEGSREMRLDAYRAVRDELMRRIAQRFALSPPPVV
ncbi:MAG TPA: arsenate reductase ArsC [Alphaproteobacteria bacterium]|nr:arsenate reductase ArsC [Alphaproteobacteria bacterium]